jgi:hypothetical protein
MKCSEIRGFNYQPSYGSTSFENWINFDPEINKPLLVTETCWGSLDDQWRVENIKFTLKELKKRNIGWLAHALHYSLVADLHYPEDGPVGSPGNLAFIKNSTLAKII